MLQDVFPDKATERKILSFIIKCPSEGCGWTGELRNKEVVWLIQIPLIISKYPSKHNAFLQQSLWYMLLIRHEEIRSIQVSSTPNGKRCYLFWYLEDLRDWKSKHFRAESPPKSIRACLWLLCFSEMCSYLSVIRALLCKCMGKSRLWKPPSLFLFVWQVHLESCSFILLACNNFSCKVKVQRRHLEQHQLSECPWRILSCEYCSEPHPECQMQVRLSVVYFTIRAWLPSLLTEVKLGVTLLWNKPCLFSNVNCFIY